MTKTPLLVALIAISGLGTAIASPQTTGTIDINNSNSGPITIDRNEVNVTGNFSKNILVSRIDSGSTQNAVYIAGPTQTSVTLTVKVHSLANQSYGCTFQVAFAYEYSMNGSNYYYPNTSATPFYPTNATKYPTCYAEPGGPSEPIDSFYEYFSIKGL